VYGRFDSGYPEHERFAASFTIQFEELVEGDVVRVRASLNGVQMGQTLTDNSYEDDGYRFHDVFHLACVAGLGWSPVTRRNLGLKRKSDPRVDEVEDGGRAIVIEEGLTALIFSYALEHNWLRNVVPRRPRPPEVDQEDDSSPRSCSMLHCRMGADDPHGVSCFGIKSLRHRRSTVELDLTRRLLRFV